jgi:8-oxo-dGTP diphosphatase
MQKPREKRSSKNKKKEYHDPIPTIDIILRKSTESNQDQILIEKRGLAPFEGMYAIPGGHVEYGETVEEAALRELKEESGLNARLVNILGVYSDPNRDPRGQRISTVFVADHDGGRIMANDDAKSVEWISLSKLLEMKDEIAFDHYQILNDFKKWLANSTVAMTFWSTKSS